MEKFKEGLKLSESSWNFLFLLFLSNLFYFTQKYIGLPLSNNFIHPLKNWAPQTCIVNPQQKNSGQSQVKIS